MVIKEGYKQTEIGVIPMNWEVNTVQELIDDKFIVSHLDGNHGALYPKSHEFKENGVPYIGANDFLGGKVSFNNCKYLSNERAEEFRKGIAIDGDVLFAHNATVGPVAFLETSLNYIILSTTATYFRCDNNNLINKYLIYALQSPSFIHQYSAIMSQSTRCQVPITAQRKLNLIIPTPAEQTAIATALSDADGLITGLEKLIAKKRNIKQGAMQQLLQPKEGWEVKKLGEICDITGAGIDKKINPNEISVTLLNYLDVYRRDYIYRNELNHKVTAPYNKMLSCDVKKGDIFLTPSSELRTDIGISAISMEDMDGVVYSYHIYRLRFNTNIDKLFGLFLLKTNSFLMQAETFCEGSGKRYVISMGKFKEMTVSFPNSLIEQTRIATILSDMDAELSALEQKLEKYKKIKLGMMQELLTGKTRLI